VREVKLDVGRIVTRDQLWFPIRVSPELHLSRCDIEVVAENGAEEAATDDESEGVTMESVATGLPLLVDGQVLLQLDDAVRGEIKGKSPDMDHVGCDCEG
jgi:hypothetical protein